MKKRLFLLAGLGIGYVLGSRAGRQSYEKLKNQVQELWGDPRVQDTVQQATEAVKEKAPEVTAKVQESAAHAVDAAKSKASEVSEDVKSRAAEKKADKDAAKHAEKQTDSQVKAAQGKDSANVADPAPAARKDTVSDPETDPAAEGGPAH